MNKRVVPAPWLSLRFFSWPAALVAIVALKAVLSIAVKPGSFMVAFSISSSLILLLLATGFAIRNGIQNTLGARPFWLLFATGSSLWAFHQVLALYYEFGLHIGIPDKSIADTVQFLHLVPFMAAVATLPHRNVIERKLYRWVLDSILLLIFWTFLYGFTVAPYQYLFSSASYVVRIDVLYAIENFVLVLAVAFVIWRAKYPWRLIYLHLFGACGLYALSSTFANLATDSGGHVHGKLYGLGLTASVCLLVWVPIYARQVQHAEVERAGSNVKESTQATLWAMIFVLLVAIPIAWELLQRDENPAIRTLRLIVALTTLVCIAGATFVKDFFAKRDLSSNIRLADDKLRLALQAAGTAVWEFDLGSGRGLWFGDLRIIFGIPSETYAAGMEEFIDRLHPDDREKVSETLDQAKEFREFYSTEFRLIGFDGTLRWLVARGKFYYTRDGEPERLLGMVTNITERKQAEEALRESEEQFRSVFRDAGIGMVIVSPGGRFLAANPLFCEYLGYTEEELLAKTVQSITFDEDWPAFSKKLGQALEEGRGFQRFEKRCLHKSGRLVYTESSASLIRNHQGAPQYFVGEVLDVTQRKESEQALLSFNQRLIQTQEQERIRIARELHDDVSQRVVMLAIGLHQLEQGTVNSGDMSDQITNMQKAAVGLSKDIQHLSHELHSSSLELLGVQAAMRSWCNEFSEKHKLEIHFESQEIPRSVPSEISLTLYRVLQEALNNAARHSGVKHFEVRLWGFSNEIHLTVKDLGVGFDPAAFARGRGLGLKSMRERLKLVSGHLAIESRANQGTKIYARVPLTSRGQSALKTGTGTAS
jgi:PAS domain S-box-containing protein